MIPDTARIGSVPYLNAVPLTCGLEGRCSFLPPSALAVELRSGRLEAALLSVTEALFAPGYPIVDGVAIASDGPVFSVFLAQSAAPSPKQTYLDRHDKPRYVENCFEFR